MKILLDMNMAFRWAVMLRERGIDAIHWADIGQGDAPDAAIMAYAADGGYTVLTNDLDFGTLLALTGVSKPSVIQLRAPDVRPEDLLEPVADAVFRLSARIEQGALITIDIDKTRIHILPFT